MGIDEAVDFFTEYLTVEYDAAVAARTESDEILDLRTAALEGYLWASPDTIMSSTVGRARGWTAERLAKSALTVGQVARRTLFLVAGYSHPKWNPLFAAYVGGPTHISTGSYGQLLFAAHVDQKLAIISESFPELLEPSPPMKWSHAQGVRIGELGDPVAVRALAAPTLEEHKRDWLRIKGTQGDTQ